jgi:hypothetical protein
VSHRKSEGLSISRENLRNGTEYFRVSILPVNTPVEKPPLLVRISYKVGEILGM